MKFLSLRLYLFSMSLDRFVTQTFYFNAKPDYNTSKRAAVSPALKLSPMRELRKLA